MVPPLWKVFWEPVSEKATTGTRERPRRQDGVAQDRKRQEPRAEFNWRSANGSQSVPKAGSRRRVGDVAAKAHSLVAAEYAGTTVSQMTAMRKKARETGVYLRVVKNTLASRAVAGTEFEVVQDKLVGPLLYAFSTEEPGAAGRLIKEFAKGNDKLQGEGRRRGWPAVSGQRTSRCWRRCRRCEQALAMLARVLTEPVTMFARAVKAVADQQGGGEAAPSCRSRSRRPKRPKLDVRIVLHPKTISRGQHNVPFQRTDRRSRSPPRR